MALRRLTTSLIFFALGWNNRTMSSGSMYVSSVRVVRLSTWAVGPIVNFCSGALKTCRDSIPLPADNPQWMQVSRNSPNSIVWLPGAAIEHCWPVE